MIYLYLYILQCFLLLFLSKIKTDDVLSSLLSPNKSLLALNKFRDEFANVQHFIVSLRVKKIYFPEFALS